MSRGSRLALVSALVSALGLGAACSSTQTPPQVADAPVGNPSDARQVFRLPTWQLEDIEPTSPRVGQTYGLDTFGAKVVVVTLVEGF